jgi:hypothetical protein
MWCGLEAGCFGDEFESLGNSENVVCAFWGHSAEAASGNQTGHIVSITTAPTGLLLMLDAGPPGLCSGTPFGWMSIAPSNSAMAALVLGLYLRGDLSTLEVTVYTSGAVDSAGFCSLTQVAPP